MSLCSCSPALCNKNRTFLIRSSLYMYATSYHSSHYSSHFTHLPQHRKQRNRFTPPRGTCLSVALMMRSWWIPHTSRVANKIPSHYHILNHSTVNTLLLYWHPTLFTLPFAPLTTKWPTSTTKCTILHCVITVVSCIASHGPLMEVMETRIFTPEHQIVNWELDTNLTLESLWISDIIIKTPQVSQTDKK